LGNSYRGSGRPQLGQPTAQSEAPMLRFMDEGFQGDAAIGDVRVQSWRRPFKWRRASELHRKANLFSVIQADNISQGELGDCWLLAAIAVLADFPGHIMNLFEETGLSPGGRYTIKLHDIRRGWEDIVIDDLIPCDRDGRPLFAQLVGDSGSVWALLLEKAFAKFVGSYEGLVGGSTNWAWQVLTGQPWVAMWSREHGRWARWEKVGVHDCLKDAEAAARWRSSGMRGGKWTGPQETLGDDEMFKALASYVQANYAVSCSIGEGDKAEERRPDGLLARHAYSMLQVVLAHGHRIVQLRNPWGRGGEWSGPWSDGSREWRAHPEVADDLQTTDEDDGRFWMPWEPFVEIFGGNIMVCPVTLACPQNSHLVVGGGASHGKPCCPQCKQPYTRSWVMLVDDGDEGGSARCKSGNWVCLGDGSTLCFLCLRATCRASQRYLKDLRVAGVHLQPKLSFAPPRGPRRLEICEYGAACYRRNPQHFHDFFHPSLLPPAPPCASGCGRSAASGFKTCCSNCQSAPPDLKVRVHGALRELRGLYTALPGKRVRGAPVWHQERGRGWLWKGHMWMMSLKEANVGGTAGLVSADDPASMPHLVERWNVPCDDGWTHEPGISVEVDDAHAAAVHAELCDSRAAREQDLQRQAEAVLAKWSKG